MSGFLDDPAKPRGIPWTALWLAQAWQQRVLERNWLDWPTRCSTQRKIAGLGPDEF